MHRGVPGHTDVINVHDIRQIVRKLKNNEAAGDPSAVNKYATDQLLTTMSVVNRHM